MYTCTTWTHYKRLIFDFFRSLQLALVRLVEVEPQNIRRISECKVTKLQWIHETSSSSIRYLLMEEP